MSFDIRWEVLDEVEASRLKDLINSKFETSERPDFLGKLKVGLSPLSKIIIIIHSYAYVCMSQ
jgi:hypothetical protein